MTKIKCCRDCVPPTRHSGCHGACERYIEERKAYDEEMAQVRAHANAIRDVNHYTLSVADKIRKNKRCWNHKKVRGQP